MCIVQLKEVQMDTNKRYEGLRGNGNPMRRPEVAAKQSASLKAHYARTGTKPKQSNWTPERKAQRAEAARQMWADGRGRGRPKSDAEKQAQRERMQAYWAKVRSALAVLENQQHED